jgi:carbohydrate-binding DOMON domain-containing protein
VSVARLAGVAATLLAMSGPAVAAERIFEDPAGDDFGAGAIVYPTDPVYLPGSFDLRRVELHDAGDAIEVRVTFEAPVQDPWDSRAWDGNGFSLQMVQVYLDTTPDAGAVDALPGIHASFAPGDAWDRVVLIAPQGTARLKQAIEADASRFASAIVLPKKVTATERGLTVLVDRKALGGAVSLRWGVQVVVTSSEPFPEPGNLMVRKVNEVAGLHRFGGGRDGRCDPHVLDALAGAAQGAPAEVDAQKAALAYACGPGDSTLRAPVLPMLRSAPAAK